MFKKNFTIISLFVIFFLSIQNVHSIESDVFVQSTVNRATETLSGNLTKDERIEKLKKIAIDTVDIRGIGLYSLGAYRKNLSDTQKKNMMKYLNSIF